MAQRQRSKNLRRFPAEYAEAIRTVSKGGVLVIKTESLKQGQKLRGSFYAYTQALRKNKEEYRALKFKQTQEQKQLGEQLTTIDPEVEGALELEEFAPQVVVHVEADGTVKFFHRSESWQSKLMRQGVVASSGSAAASASPSASRLDQEAEAAEKRMLERLAKMDGDEKKGRPFGT